MVTIDMQGPLAVNDGCVTFDAACLAAASRSRYRRCRSHCTLRLPGLRRYLSEARRTTASRPRRRHCSEQYRVVLRHGRHDQNASKQAAHARPTSSSIELLQRTGRSETHHAKSLDSDAELVAS